MWGGVSHWRSPVIAARPAFALSDFARVAVILNTSRDLALRITVQKRDSSVFPLFSITPFLFINIVESKV